MIVDAPATDTGLLLSGGLDSAILLGELLRQEQRVQPFYIRCGQYWQQAELAAVRRYIAALRTPRLRELVLLDLPLGDLYSPDHWSISGRHVPGAHTPDEAVYLPGRNALLAIKAVLWCQLHGVRQLALAPLASNPFADATDPFFAAFEAALNHATAGNVRIVRPFAGLHKHQVMRLGGSLPLEHTFSCIHPRGELHCGVCNKCAERQAAFAAIDHPDPTLYARSPAPTR